MNDPVLRRLAGAQSYHRGLDYFSHSHVESLEETDDGVRALVRGNRNYTVTLTAEEKVPDYSCECPVGGDGAFCKHCVATAVVRKYYHQPRLVANSHVTWSIDYSRLPVSRQIAS